MAWAASLGLILTALTAVTAQSNYTPCAGTESVYEFQYKELLNHKTHNLGEYSGKVLLVTNTASF